MEALSFFLSFFFTRNSDVCHPLTRMFATLCLSFFLLYSELGCLTPRGSELGTRNSELGAPEALCSAPTFCQTGKLKDAIQDKLQSWDCLFPALWVQQQKQLNEKRVSFFFPKFLLLFCWILLLSNICF